MTILKFIENDCNVVYVQCDGLYNANCGLFALANPPRHSLSCTDCKARTSQLTSKMGLCSESISRYIHVEEIEAARKWLDDLTPENLVDCVYGDWPLYSWCASNVNTYLRDSSPDITDPEVYQLFRRYAHSCLLACFAIDRMLETVKPDVFFLFNGRLGSTRAAVELAKRKGIRVVTHERALVEEALHITVGDSCLSLEQFKRTWPIWKDEALTAQESKEIRALLTARRHGRKLSWRQFSPPPQELNALGQALGLRPGHKLCVLFTSSDDETTGAEQWKGPFELQLDWVVQTIEVARRRPEIDFVVRIHPNTSGKRAGGNNFKQLKQLSALAPTAPPNVKFVYPEDVVSSYSLMDMASVGIVYNSTIGLEMACTGLTVISASASYVSGLPFVHTVTDASSYGQLLESCLTVANGFRNPEIKEMAERYAYCIFFRNPVQLPVARMLTPSLSTLRIRSMDSLDSGQSASLERVKAILVEGKETCPTPQDYRDRTHYLPTRSEALPKKIHLRLVRIARVASALCNYLALRPMDRPNLNSWRDKLTWLYLQQR